MIPRPPARLVPSPLAAVVAALCLSVAGAPRAGSATEAGVDGGGADCDATELAEDAAEAREDGDLAEAVRLLEAARACDDAPRWRFELADAYRDAGRCVAAHDLYLSYLESGDAERRSQAVRREAETAGCAEAFEAALARSDAARASGDPEGALAALDEALGLSAEPDIAVARAEILIELGRCEEATGALAEIDAEVLSRTQRGLLEAAREGAARCEAPADPTECLAGCETERTELDAAHESATDDQRLVGVVTTAVAGATLVAAVIHDVASQGTVDDYESAVAAGDASRTAALRDDLDAQRTVSTALYGSALVLGTVGAVIWIWSARASPAEDLDCDALCWEGGLGGPGEVGVWFGGRF